MNESGQEKSRLYYLDNFRLFLIITVIFHHASMAYGGTGAWGVMDGATDPISPNLIALFNSVNQAYFMSSFFFLAGFFSPRSLDKKGKRLFLVDRLIRLGLPLVGYVLLLGNLNIYILDRFLREVPFQWRFGYDPDHLWFIQNLLAITIFYLILGWGWERLRKGPVSFFIDRFPPRRILWGSLLTIGILSFCIRIEFPVNRWYLRMQPAHLAHYIFSFAMGHIAYRSGWLNHLSREIGRRWGWMALVMVPGFYALFIFGGMLKDPESIDLFLGGFHWQALGYSLWDTIMLFSMNIFLISFFREKFNRTNKILKIMASNILTVYIIHVTILYLLQIWLIGFDIPSIVKFIIGGTLTTILCFLISPLIRKLPIIGTIFS